MKDRFLTLASAAGALALFYALFVPKDPGELGRIHHPTTAERRANGYAALLRWLNDARVPTRSLRQRYSMLMSTAAQRQHGLSRTGNLLVTTMPFRYALGDEEALDLALWVSAGNTVLVLAALADTPDWAQPGAGEGLPLVGAWLPNEVHRLTGISFEAQVPDEQESTADAEQTSGGRARALLQAMRRFDEPLRHRIVPNRAHPYFQGVQAVAAESEFPAYEWRVQQAPDNTVLSLAHDARTGRDAIWVRSYGKGALIISGYGSLFVNERLGDEDNAQLFANIVGQSLGSGGAVLFDDHHQGLSDLYDADAFFADRRLHLTIWLLLATWLIWVLGTVRLRGSRVDPPAPRETAFVEATGGFLARVLQPRQAAARLLALFFNDLRRRLSLAENGEPVWDWLERQPRVARSELHSLRDLQARVSRGQRVDLARLQNLLVTLQLKI